MTLVANAAPKNFIIVYTDDQGYKDLSAFGHEAIKTPHIDRMIKEGIKFNSMYTASSVCTPSRAALMTGRYPKRVKLPAVLFPRSQTGLDPKEITIAEMLKEKSYRTGLVGKWHLGHLPRFLPLNQGFDSYFGLPYSNDMSIAPELAISKDIVLHGDNTVETLAKEGATMQKNYRKLRNKMPLMRGNEVIEYPIDQRKLTRLYTEEAVSFIKAKSDKPFFLYLAHTMPHKPLNIEEEFVGKSAFDKYGDIIEQIDWSMGEIRKALEESGNDKNTMIFYSSDNGPAKGTGASAGKLRGMKFSTYEGGQRVCSFMWSPGTVKAGQETDEILTTMDLFPTLAHYVGAELPPDRTYDGINISDILEGKDGAKGHGAMHYYLANRTQINCIRVGDWKYVDGSKELFNLKDDVGETKNLIDTHPEKAEELRKAMREFDAGVTTF